MGAGGKSIFTPQTKHMPMHFHAFILGVKCYESKCSRYSYCLCVVNGKQWEGVWRERKHLSHSSYPCEVKKEIDCGLLVLFNKHSRVQLTESN